MIFKILLASITCLLAAGCDALSVSTVDVRNTTSHTLRRVSVDFSGRSVFVGDIAALQSKSIDGVAAGEGAISVTYVQDQQITRKEITYVSPPLTRSCRVEIGEGGINSHCRIKFVF